MKPSWEDKKLTRVTHPVSVLETREIVLSREEALWSPDNELPFWLAIGPICWEASYNEEHKYGVGGERIFRRRRGDKRFEFPIPKSFL